MKYILAVSCILSGVMALAQPQLKRTKVGDYISMEVPEEFHMATQAEIVQKNVSSRPPIAMFTSRDQKTDLVINETSNTWQGGDLEVIQSLYKSSIANLFTEIDFIQEDIQEVSGRKFIVFEFVSRVTDEDDTFGNGLAIAKYTYIQYTLYKDKILLFNFTCPAREQQYWQSPALSIMKSVRIK